MQVTVNYLSELLEVDRRTAKRRTDHLKRDDDGKLHARSAIESILIGKDGGGGEDGEFVPTPEAVRRLTLAKAGSELLDQEIKRKSRIPIDVPLQIHDEMMQATAATLKSRKGKRLDEPLVNEIFEHIREAGEQIAKLAPTPDA